MKKARTLIIAGVVVAALSLWILFLGRIWSWTWRLTHDTTIRYEGISLQIPTSWWARREQDAVVIYRTQGGSLSALSLTIRKQIVRPTALSDERERARREGLFVRDVAMFVGGEECSGILCRNSDRASLFCMLVSPRLDYCMVALMDRENLLPDLETFLAREVAFRRGS